MLRKYSWIGIHVLIACSLGIMLVSGAMAPVAMADEDENPAIEDPPIPPPVEEDRFATFSMGGVVAFVPKSLAPLPNTRRKVAAITASVLADAEAAQSVSAKASPASAKKSERYVLFTSLTPTVKYQIYTKASLPSKFRYGMVYFANRDNRRKLKKDARDLTIHLKSDAAAPQPDPQQEDLANPPQPDPQQEDLVMAPQPEPQVEDLK